jgi:chaperonin GroES
MADSVSIKPLADRVVAQQVEAEQKTASGIYLPDKAQEKPKVAKVVAAGPDCKSVKVGDKILYEDFSTTNVKVGTQEYIIVKEEKILATIK